MARQMIERLVDDLDGTVLEEGEGQSIEFAYRGKRYHIDLSSANAEEFDAAMAKFIKAASPMRGGAAGRRPAGQGSKTGKDQNQAVRDWLRAQGHSVNARGRIKGDLMDLYNTAH